MTTYAWMITKDHITPEGEEGNAVGVMGPGAASDEAIDKILEPGARIFRMYDDDGILYYTGRLVDLSGEWDEEACYAPLGNYGMPAAGAVLIKYQGHPEMDCG